MTENIEVKLPKKGDEFFTVHADTNEDDGEYNGRIRFETWVVVSVGRKWVGLHRRDSITWVKVKGEYQWKNLTRWDKKGIRTKSWPCDPFSDIPELHTTKTKAVESKIVQLKRLLKNSKVDSFRKDFEYELALFEKRRETMRKNNAKARKAQKKEEVHV